MNLSAVNTIISQQMQQSQAANNKYSNEIQRILMRDLRPFNLCNALSLAFIFISSITKRKHSGNVKFRIRTKQPADCFSLGGLGYIYKIIS